MPMMGLELQVSGFRSNCSTNWATNTAYLTVKLIHLLFFQVVFNDCWSMLALKQVNVLWWYRAQKQRLVSPLWLHRYEISHNLEKTTCFNYNLYFWVSTNFGWFRGTEFFLQIIAQPSFKLTLEFLESSFNSWHLIRFGNQVQALTEVWTKSSKFYSKLKSTSKRWKTRAGSVLGSGSEARA